MTREAFGSRLREERTRVGLDQRELAAVAGVGRNSQIAYEGGRTAPDADYLLAVQGRGIDIPYLFTGHRGGELTQSVMPAEADEGMVEVVEVDLAYGLGGSFAQDDPDLQKHRFPQAWIETITRAPPSMLFFARGRGDSMTPTISDGDLVLIDRSQRTVREQDGLWALTLGEIAQIKRVRIHANRVELLSDNERVPPYDAVQDEINVVGRVIFIGRRVG